MVVVEGLKILHRERKNKHKLLVTLHLCNATTMHVNVFLLVTHAYTHPNKCSNDYIFKGNNFVIVRYHRNLFSILWFDSSSPEFLGYHVQQSGGYNIVHHICTSLWGG
jgi:hypothetical protein